MFRKALTQKCSEARSAGNVRDRPLIVVSSDKADWAPEYRSAWTALQSDLAKLSRQGKLVTNAANGDLIYEAPEAIVAAVREVVGEVRK